jgi:hypothetical protein
MLASMHTRWTNIALFILFFGISALEAFRSQDWVMAVFWILIAVVFLAGDLIGQRRR